MNHPHQFDKRDEAERDRLRAMLLEDMESADEAETLLDVVMQIKRWSPVEPDISTTAKLIETLQAEMSPTRTFEAGLMSLIRLVGEWWPLLLMRAQVRVVRGEIWAASALVMLLGTVVTLISYTPASNGLAPIAIFAPLVAAVGVAFLYNNEVIQMLEIENSTPASSRILLLTRLTLVFSFDFILGLIGSLFLALVNAEVSLWPLVMSWLAPMAFLSATSFLLSILLGDALVGSLFGLLIWGTHVWLRSFPEDDLLYSVLSLPGLSSSAYRPLLFACAALLVGIALWVASREERMVAPSRQ
jgi:hypothetical protein